MKKHNKKLVTDVIDDNESRVDFLGVISRIKEIKTKNNDLMAFLELQDAYNSLDCVLFPKTYAIHKNMITIGNVLVFKGKKDIRNNKLQIIIDHIYQIMEDEL